MPAPLVENDSSLAEEVARELIRTALLRLSGAGWRPEQIRQLLHEELRVRLNETTRQYLRTIPMGPRPTRGFGAQLKRTFESMTDGYWYTLPELASKANVPLHSVGTRVRDLRKNDWGKHRVDVRRRQGSPREVEYRLVLPELSHSRSEVTKEPGLR